MSAAETVPCTACGVRQLRGNLLEFSKLCLQCALASARAGNDLRLDVAAELLAALEGLLWHGGGHLDDLSFRGGGNPALRTAMMRARAAVVRAHGGGQ
jgi:hypothetical protein